MGIDKAAGKAPKELPRTRVVLIINEETGELDYFVIRDRAEVIVLEQPALAPVVYEVTRRCH